MMALLFLCLLSAPLVASQETTPLMCTQGPNGTQAPKTCPTDMDACVAIRDNNKLSDAKAKPTLFFTCGKKGSCSSAFTITIAEGRYLHYSSACCTTADCNANLDWGVPPASLTKNDLFCQAGCFTETEENCEGGKVLCTDEERTCISATGTTDQEGAKTFVLKGCGTSNVCDLKGQNVIINGTSLLVQTTDCKDAKSSSINHILGKSSFLLLLPSISSILLMKFLS